MNSRQRIFAFALLFLMAGAGRPIADEGVKSEYMLDESGAIPKLYYCLRDRRDLSADAFDAIIKAVELKDYQTAWFLEVHTVSNEVSSQEVYLFYRPVSLSNSIRHGEAVYVLLDHVDSTPRIQRSRRFKYVQIVPPDAAELRIPTPRYLPFEDPGGLSDDDILAAEVCGRNGAIRSGATEASDRPLGMSVPNAEAVRIYIGHGAGVIVTCRRQGSRFVADEQVSHFFAP